MRIATHLPRVFGPPALRRNNYVMERKLHLVGSIPFDTAEEVSARVDATSKLTWMVVRNPLVKLASVSVASDRIASRLRRSGEDDGPVERGDEPLALPSPAGGRSRRRERRRKAG